MATVLGSKIRRLRKRKGYTLAKAGGAMDLSVSFLSDLERGRTKPSLDTLESLADLYEVSVSELLGGGDDEDEPTWRAPNPEGLDAFLEEQPDVDEWMVELLLLLEHRARSKPKTSEDWRRLYYLMMSALGR